jgi:hypothetical protein
LVTVAARLAALITGLWALGLWLTLLIFGVVLFGVPFTSTGARYVTSLFAFFAPGIVLPFLPGLFLFIALQGAKSIEITDAGIRVRTLFRGSTFELREGQLYRPVIERGRYGVGVIHFEKPSKRLGYVFVVQENARKVRSLAYYPSLRVSPDFVRHPARLAKYEG